MYDHIHLIRLYLFNLSDLEGLIFSISPGPSNVVINIWIILMVSFGELLFIEIHTSFSSYHPGLF